MLVIGIACRNKQGVQRTILFSPYISERIHWPTGWKLQEFDIDPLLGRSICHAPWPKVNPIVHSTSYTTHIPFIPSESTLPFLSYSNFDILSSKSKVKVWGEDKVWSYNVSLTFYRPITLSFHVNRPSHSWDKTFSKFDHENSRSKSWLRSKLKVTKMGVTFYQLKFLSSHVNRPSHSCDTAFSQFDHENPRSRS